MVEPWQYQRGQRIYDLCDLGAYVTYEGVNNKGTHSVAYHHRSGEDWISVTNEQLRNGYSHTGRPRK